MSVQEIQGKAIEAVTMITKAVVNLRLYPITSAIVTQALDRLFEVLTAILGEASPLVLAEADRKLIVAGEPFQRSDQERPHVQAFINLLVDLNVMSLSLDEGVTREEIGALIQALSRNPKAALPEGGLEGILLAQEVQHIRIDEMVYVAKDKDQQLVASLDIDDDEIVSLLMGDNPDSADIEQVREKAKDPEWITSIFQTGMKRMQEQQDSVPNLQLSENLVQMVRMLEKIVAPGELERISRLVAQSVTEMDSDMISLVLSRDVQGLFGGQLFAEIVGSLDGERFAAVADGLAGIALQPGERSQTASLSLEALMKTDKGQKLESERRAQAEQEKAERAQRIAGIMERLQGMLKGEESAFLDPGLAAELPGFVRDLFAGEEHATADALLKRIAEKLLHRNPDLRSRAAELLSGILAEPATAARSGQAGPLAERLAGWLRSEPVFGRAWESVCRQLTEWERAILAQDPFGESNPILDVLSMIHSGRLPKDPAMQAQAGGALCDLAGEGLLKTLFEEFKTDGRGKQKAAGRNLSRLGAAPMERLLDMLRDSQDSAERVRVLQVISEIGSPSVAPIVARLTRGDAWYVLRNLVYALGRVGTETQAADLAPFLLHDNPQLQMETLKSLQRIGGKARATILTSVLPGADDAFKLNIVETLGSIKAREAVPLLAEMLQAKTSAAAAMKADLAEKICLALGAIGSEDALPALTEITKSRGFFSSRTYPEKVRLAAGKASAAITRR